MRTHKREARVLPLSKFYDGERWAALPSDETHFKVIPPRAIFACTKAQRDYEYIYTWFN